jgi:hypothetical protein
MKFIWYFSCNSHFSRRSVISDRRFQAAIVVCGLIALLLVVIFFILFWNRKKKIYAKDIELQAENAIFSTHIATDDVIVENLISDGPYGKVYKANLKGMTEVSQIFSEFSFCNQLALFVEFFQSN